jgi:hypothetical protein
MEEDVTDLVSVFERFEEDVEAFLRDGRVFIYTRDLVRLVAWLRAQPRSRVLLLAALGAGTLAGLVLLSTVNRPIEPGRE